MNLQALLQSTLSAIRFGELELVTPEGVSYRYRGAHPGEAARVVLHDWSVLGAVLANGDVGLGETYMDERWDTDDLPAFLTVCQRNRQAFSQLRGVSLVNKFRSVLTYLRQRNTLSGSKQNMANSYDYPPGLYQSFTDRMMTYSSGWWDGKEMSLDDAQLNKYLRILERLGPPPQHILEMGCGWGYFLKLAAERGYSVTGCTVSRQQYDYARELNADAIIDGRVTVLLDDYRNMPGQYDAVMSTGFFEHVGEKFWVPHFNKVKQYLKTGGVCMVQTMLVNTFDRKDARELNFITKYIFPGGEFPSIGSFILAAEQAGLKCEEHVAFGQDYARTMAACWQNFHANLADVSALGFDRRFIRMWEFFLASWYAMFKSENYNVMQAKLVHYP